MAKAYSIADARKRFSELVDDAATGAAVHIHRRGRPIAVLVSSSWFDAMTSPSVPFAVAYGEWRTRYREEIETLDLEAAFVAVRDTSPGRDFRW